MRRVLILLLIGVGVVAILAGAFLLWRQRPWRTAVSVNGRVLTAQELELRALTLLDDARRVEHLTFSGDREAEALRHYRREAVKMWIVKEVLLAEAVARGYEATAEDESSSLVQMSARLKSRNLTPEAFFKEGPIPEHLKRRDFREGVLINKFTEKELRDKIHVTPQEIEARQNELKQLALMRTKPGEKPRLRMDRRAALESVRRERFHKEFRSLFRSLFQKSEVRVPEFPDLEALDVVSPPRPEDRPAGPRVESIGSSQNSADTKSSSRP